MRTIKIAPDEYYHIYNRGYGKQIIFKDNGDYFRFLFLILYFQSSISFENISRLIKEFSKNLCIDKDLTKDVIKGKRIELVGFCLMPNHFHLILKEGTEGGIAQYMQRVLNSYTKYFNTKYERTGHLFQGPYKAVHVENNEQLLHLSAYIHRNPRELGNEWKNREEEYFWSSYQDFTKKNRFEKFGKLISTDIILEQFKNKNDYKKFIKTSLTKTDDTILDF